MCTPPDRALDRDGRCPIASQVITEGGLEDVVRLVSKFIIRVYLLTLNHRVI
jgi:hypothetical protein